jgi:hypothetical protein
MARNNLSNSYTEAILFEISPHCNMEICKIANTHTTLSTYLCRSHIKALQSRYLHGKGKNCRLQRCRPSARHHMHQSDCDSRDLYQCSLHVNSKKALKKVTVDMRDCAFGFSLSISSFGVVGVLWQFTCVGFGSVTDSDIPTRDCSTERLFVCI